MCADASEDKAFLNNDTNTHLSAANYPLKEWKDIIFDTDTYAHIYYRQKHYFQVRPYDTDFFRRELSEASESLVENILVLMSCETCLADAVAGDDDVGNGNEIEL